MRALVREPVAIGIIAAVLLLGGCGYDSESLLQSAHVLEGKGDYAGAIAHLTTGVRAEPAVGALRYHLGRNYSLAFDWPAAEQGFRKAAELGVVEGGRVALGLSRALLQQRKYEQLVAEVVAAPAFERGILASVHALRGDALLSLDRIAEAKRELTAAEKLDARNVDLALLQARMKAAGRDVHAAIQVVEKLLAEDPKNVEAWIHKADLLTILGRPREALASLDRGLEIQPRHLNALVGRATVLVQLGRLHNAQKDVETLTTAYPKTPALAYLRGQIHYWRGEYREALEMARAMLRTDQQSPAARLLGGMASMMLEAPVQAEYELARYESLHPRNLLVHAVTMELRAEIQQRGSGSKVLAYTHADELREASVQALFGDAYIRVWQHSKIADWFERSAAGAPPDLILLVKQAQRRFTGEQLDTAALDIERALAASESKTLSMALVLVQLARRDAAKAMEAVSVMEKLSPSSPQTETVAGIVLNESNQFVAAGRRLDQALQYDPKFIAAVVARARLDIAAGNLDLVRRRFEDALKIVPNNLQALVIYAYFQEMARRRSEAKALLNRAIEMHPKALEPRVLLIDLLKKENEKAAAMVVAAETLAIHPDDPIAIEQAADILLWNGDQRRGLEILEQLVRVLPRSPESYFKLARAQYKAGLQAEAEANLGRALALPMDQLRIERLHVFGLVDNSKVLEAIELARKSYKVPRGLQVGRELWSSGMGGITRYDALSGTGAR